MSPDLHTLGVLDAHLFALEGREPGVVRTLRSGCRPLDVRERLWVVRSLVHTHGVAGERAVRGTGLGDEQRAGMIRLGPLLARRGHLGGARGGGAILRMSGWGCFNSSARRDLWAIRLGTRASGRAIAEGSTHRELIRHGNTRRALHVGHVVHRVRARDCDRPDPAPSSPVSDTASIISVWTDRSPEGRRHPWEIPHFPWAPPPPSRGHSPGERGDTAREDSVRYLTRTSGSRRGRQSAMAAQLELSQVGPRRSLKLRPANNRLTPSLPFPSPGCASRLGR